MEVIYSASTSKPIERSSTSSDEHRLDVCTSSIMDSIRYSLLYRSRQAFLQRLRHLGVTSSMRHFPRVLVAVGIVSCVGNLLLNALGDL